MPTLSPQLQGSGEGRQLLAVLREGQVGLPHTCRYCEIFPPGASEPAQFLGPWRKEEEISSGCWGKSHMEGGNRSVKCLSLAGPKGIKRRLEQAYLVPPFQALCKADMVSVCVVLLHLASLTCLCG